ncbi:MAG: hypothetical protein IIB38_13300 [Candidatus Hydrogenedentes bacterium]|nr:hypothetical protein [Candidatus Hydrogenedentota bacterium]
MLAHVFEAQGLATVSISVIRSHTERIKPPRALHCEFPMGRPLGKPGEPEYQRRVLDAAFKLLDATEGPVLEDFPDTIEDVTGQALSCKIPPRMDPDAPESVDEARAIRGAYDRAVEKSGRTNVGRLADADGVPALIESFLKIKDGAQWNEAGVPQNNLLEATKDIMSYYEEAATELAGHVPAARAAETWFFNETVTGQLLKDVKEVLHEAKSPIWFYITPMTQ